MLLIFSTRPDKRGIRQHLFMNTEKRTFRTSYNNSAFPFGAVVSAADLIVMRCKCEEDGYTREN